MTLPARTPGVSAGAADQEWSPGFFTEDISLNGGHPMMWWFLGLKW